MIDAIHMGDYKTATTWLQNGAFLQHPELLYVDLPSRFPRIASLFCELRDARDLDFDTASMRERFKRELAPLGGQGKKLIASRESLYGGMVSGDNFRRTAKRLHDVFGDTRILLVIREQFSMLASLYSQYVKMGGTLSLREFVRDPIMAGRTVARLQYHKNVETLVEIFGEENVCVRLYEELKEERSEFLRRIFSFIGCRDCGFLPLESGQPNTSLTTVGAFLQRRLNRLVRTHVNPSANVVPIDKVVALLLLQERKEKLVREALVQMPDADFMKDSRELLLHAINMGLCYKLSCLCESIQIGDKIEVPAELRRWLAPMLAPGNRLLMERHGLEVSRYGWTV